MTLKSYFSPTVEAAMAQAARELGPEAMLVYSRETPVESRDWGRYEVVFGWEMNRAGTEAAASSVPAPETRFSETQNANRNANRAEMNEKSSVSDASVPASTPSLPGLHPSHDWHALLTGAGFSGSLAGLIAHRCQMEPLLVAKRPPSQAFWRDLGEWIPIDKKPDLKRAGVVVIAGPPGVGKSSTLAKIAIWSASRDGKPLHLVATDTDRICGGRWLERFAELTGAKFSAVSSLGSFEELIHSVPPAHLVLVEASNWLGANAAAWLAFRRRNPSVQVQLMLPAPHRLEDVRNTFRRFQRLEPDRIIAARLDESAHYGAVCSVAAENQLPISYLTTGETLPEAFEPASIERLMAGTLGLAGAVSGGGA